MTSRDQLKLKLIESILNTKEEAVLRAALKVLQLGKGSAGFGEMEEQTLPELLNQEQPPVQGGAQDLQKDIDQVFNP